MASAVAKSVAAETSGAVTIVIATRALLDAEEAGVADLAAELDVVAPGEWPPQYNGPETRAWMRSLLEAHPGEPGYGAWYVVGNRMLVGICGFKGPPDQDGIVEVGYSIIPTQQRRGFGSAAVGMLVERAFRDPRVRTVAAETLPALDASQALLSRCGFQLASRRVEPEIGEVWRFERHRGEGA